MVVEGLCAPARGSVLREQGVVGLTALRGACGPELGLTSDAHLSASRSCAEGGVLGAAARKHCLQEGEKHRPGIHA